MAKNRLALLVVTLMFCTVSCDRERTRVIQMSFGREENWRAAESCPQVELDLDMNLESDEEAFNTFEGTVNFGRQNIQTLSPAQLGIGNVEFVKFLNFPVLQSALTFFTLLGLSTALLCMCVCVISCLTCRPKSLKKYFRPTCGGVAKQWASDMSDVFVFFPCKGVYFLLHHLIMVPLRALLAFGSSILAARTTRLQQKLMQEAEGLEERPKGKILKQRDRGNGNRATPSSVAIPAKKVQQKSSPAVEKKKESEVLKTNSGTSISGSCPIVQPLKATSNYDEASVVLSPVLSPVVRREPAYNENSPIVQPLKATSNDDEASVECSPALVQELLESSPVGGTDGVLTAHTESSSARSESAQELEAPTAANQVTPELSVVQPAESQKAPARKVAAKETKETSKKVPVATSKAAPKASVPPSRPQDGGTVETPAPPIKKAGSQALESETRSSGKKEITSPTAPTPPRPRPVAQETPEEHSKSQVAQTPQKSLTKESDQSLLHSVPARRGAEISVSKAKVAPPPFPPPGLEQSNQPLETPVRTKPPPPPNKPDLKPSNHNKILKLPHNLGPPPPGPAPAPPMLGGKILEAESDSIASTKTIADTQRAPTRPSKSSNDCLGTRLDIWSSKTLVENLRDNGTISGGTGCTVDFGSTSEKVIELMTQQINQTNMAREQLQEKAMELAGQEDHECMQLQGANDTFDDASLEAMVEDLVAMDIDLSGATSFFEEEDEDNNVDLDAAGLRFTAPAFVPGQMWTGTQRSAFID